MTTRRILPGELLAIEAGAIHRGADGFFFMFGPSITPSSRHAVYGDVCIVHIRGVLEHHLTSGSDSYEGVLCRVSDAMSGADCCEPGADPVPPSAVILCIDSKGGVVAGLNETVLAIQKLRKVTGVPLIAYVNELAASAAFALTCACDETYCPDSAILGSIGTISTMMSIAEADKKAGLDVRLLTSGARKADGHPHAPISDAAEAAEQERVEGAADAFFKLAAKARGVSADKLKGYQAALFVGSQAVKAKLANDVLCLDDLALALSSTSRAGGMSAKGNTTDRRATLARKGTAALDSGGTVKSMLPTDEAEMNAKLEALIKKTEARFELATDPKKKARFAADLASFRMTALRAESDSDDDSDEDDEDDEDSKSKKAAEAASKAKKKAEAMKHKAKAAEYRQKAEEAEEEARKAEAEDDEEEDEAKKAARASASRAALPEGAMAAITSQAEMVPEAVARIAVLEEKLADRERKASIEEAMTSKRITPSERKTLLGKPLAFVTEFLSMRPKAIVQTEGTDEVPVMSEGAIPSDLKAIIEKGVADAKAMGLKNVTAEKLEAQYRANGVVGKGRAV